MAEIESIRVVIEAETRPLDVAFKRIEQTTAGVSAKLDRQFGALNVRLGLLREELRAFRMQADEAGNAVGRLLEDLGKLLGMRPLEVLGRTLSELSPATSASQAGGRALADPEPTALLAEFERLQSQISLLVSADEDLRAIAGIGDDIADVTSKQKAVVDELAGRVSRVAAALGDAAGPDGQMPDTAPAQELRKTLDELLHALEEIRRTTSSPEIRSLIDRFPFMTDRPPGQRGALGIVPSGRLAAAGPGPATDALQEQQIALAGVSDELARAAAGSERFGDAQRELSKTARDLGFTFASAFEDAVVEGRRLSDVLRGLEQDILRILTRKLVTEPLAGAVTGLIGEGQGLFADLFHGGGTVGATPVSGHVVPASLFADVPRFAGGGIVPRSPRLAPGEVPAILHRGEVVRTPAQEAALQRRTDGGVTIQPGAIVIQTPSPQAFSESRGQIEAMLADAVRRGRRFR